RGSDRSSKPHRHKHSAQDFSPPGRRGEESSWAEAELLKERPRAGQAVPCEPAEELLRSMCRHQDSKHQSNEQQSNRHVISLTFTICVSVILLDIKLYDIDILIVNGPQA